MEVSGQLHTLATSPLGKKELLVPIGWRLDEPWSQSVHGGKDKKIPAPART